MSKPPYDPELLISQFCSEDEYISQDELHFMACWLIEDRKKQTERVENMSKENAMYREVSQRRGLENARLRKVIKAVADHWYYSGAITVPEWAQLAIDALGHQEGPVPDESRMRAGAMPATLQARQAYVDVPLTNETLQAIASGLVPLRNEAGVIAGYVPPNSPLLKQTQDKCPEPSCDLIRGHTETHEADWTTEQAIQDKLPAAMASEVSASGSAGAGELGLRPEQRRKSGVEGPEPAACLTQTVEQKAEAYARSDAAPGCCACFDDIQIAYIAGWNAATSRPEGKGV